MFPFTDITPILFQTLGAVFMEPQILELFLLVVAIVALQHYRMGRAKEKFLACSHRRVWRQVWGPP